MTSPQVPSADAGTDAPSTDAADTGDRSAPGDPDGKRRGTLPRWERVVAVVAHPDDEAFGLGAVIDCFVTAGASLRVLSLTEGSTPGTGINLGRRRREELAEASARLGASATLHNHPDGSLLDERRHVLAGEVIDEVGTSGADGLLVFDTAGVTGHRDHVAATSAALLAAEVLDLPVLAWTLPHEVARELNDEPGAVTFVGRSPEEIDLVVTVDRARQVAATRAHQTTGPTSALGRRLELLGDREHLRWLRAAH